MKDWRTQKKQRLESTKIMLIFKKRSSRPKLEYKDKLDPNLRDKLLQKIWSIDMTIDIGMDTDNINTKELQIFV